MTASPDRSAPESQDRSMRYIMQDVTAAFYAVTDSQDDSPQERAKHCRRLIDNALELYGALRAAGRVGPT